MAKNSNNILTMNVSDMLKHKYFQAGVCFIVSILLIWLSVYFYRQIKTEYCKVEVKCLCGSPLNIPDDYECRVDPENLSTRINKGYVFATVLSAAAAASTAGLGFTIVVRKKSR